MTPPRADYEVIVSQVRAHARVLDVGCGDGALLQRLIREKQVKGRGMELSQAGVNACVGKGLAVVQGDADRDLQFFPDRSFDYVILSKTIQAVHRPGAVLSELARIGDRVIVSLPNFGHWRTRLSLLVHGRMPVNASLPAAWHETENIHLCTVRDFAALSESLGLMVERAFPISRGHAGAPFAATLWRANWFAEDVVFVLRAREAPARPMAEVVPLRA
ncbi:MAG: methionine biosynthesis protein MetW [Hyphomonadaceae bacterium]|nr:methionine biosynthesis protein MetW [Hyphomonadaceae bacterium]